MSKSESCPYGTWSNFLLKINLAYLQSKTKQTNKIKSKRRKLFIVFKVSTFVLRDWSRTNHLLHLKILQLYYCGTCSANIKTALAKCQCLFFVQNIHNFEKQSTWVYTTLSVTSFQHYSSNCELSELWEAKKWLKFFIWHN